MDDDIKQSMSYGRPDKIAITFIQYIIIVIRNYYKIFFFYSIKNKDSICMYIYF